MTKLTRRAVLGAASLSPLVLAATRAHAADHQVTISGFAFSPSTLTVSAGDTVTFTNEDGAPHTATARDGSFDTARLNRGESATITVQAAGQHEFFCQFHPNMTGTITVS